MSPAHGLQALGSQLAECAPPGSHAEAGEHMNGLPTNGPQASKPEAMSPAHGLQAPEHEATSSAHGLQALDSSQLHECASPRTYAEAREHMNGLPANGPRAIESQLPERAPVRNQTEMGESMDCLPTEGDDTKPSEPFDVTMELPQGSVNPPHPQQLSPVDDQFPAQTQQSRLFDDPRRHKLFTEYNEVIRQNPDSHLARLGEVAQYVFDNGRPARVWTAGGEGSARVGLDPNTKSIHGMCSCKYDEADILLLTESEHAAWSRANNPPKLVVLRDPEFSRRRPAKSTESWLREQEKRTHKKWVDVQRLNRKCDDGAAENIPLRGAIQQWRIAQGSNAISLETPPMNLLNISDKTVGHWPEGLAKDYQLLFDAIDECEGMIYRSLDERLVPLSEQDRGIGKTTLMLFSHSDIQKCTQFRILAHRGACSSWHIDNAGVYTFIVLEGNSDDPGEEAEDVVKYWPVYPTHHMSAEDERVARVGFSKEGINWRPKPKDKIPVIALTRGDMLIQPPGTIHAPITLTNCFFLGGMAWRKNTLPLTLNVWHYLMKNEICTNEPLPRQSQAILDFIRVAVHDAPEEHGYREDELGEFDKICDEISGMVSKCGCSKACSLSTKCSCLMQGLKCGIRCHKGGTLHHTTCTTVNMLSPSSLSGKKKYTKRSRLRDDEDSDYMSNGTPIAKSKRKKIAIDALQAKEPNATLDAIALLPHGNISPAVAGSDYSNGTPSAKPKRKRAVVTPKEKSLDVSRDSIVLLPNARANNSLAVADPTELKRPETCPGSSTGGTCEYVEGGRGGRVACKYCRTAIVFDSEAIPNTRPRAIVKVDADDESGSTKSPSTKKAVSLGRTCHNCKRSTITVDRKGPDGPRTLCGKCAKKWTKARLDQETENEVASPDTLMLSIEKAAAYEWSKENRERQANNKGKPSTKMDTFDEAKATSDVGPGGRRETPSKSRKRETPKASGRRSTPLIEDYCLQCQTTTKSSRWYNHENFTDKGKRCSRCYQSDYSKAARERRRSLVGTKTASPSPATNNEPSKPTGIKIRLSPALGSSGTKGHNEDRMDKIASQQHPSRPQDGMLPPSFDASPSLSQAERAIFAPKSDFLTDTELPIAAKQQESAQHELAGAYPLQHSDPQVLTDLQNFVSDDATPEKSVEHKPESGLIIQRLEPQTHLALAPENPGASPLKSLNLSTEPEAPTDLPATSGSTSTESLAEHSNSQTSSPLTSVVDMLSDPEDADLVIVS
ncbi:hypothetical protein O988_01724 [Pseudogymnoascus sp. VKM F-3808]|nr:hypothetical protein O988_01724 [Pseudogymnoascus sp. VKM F-3808]